VCRYMNISSCHTENFDRPLLRTQKVLSENKVTLFVNWIILRTYILFAGRTGKRNGQNVHLRPAGL
jgi:hypothetical protein